MRKLIIIIAVLFAVPAHAFVATLQGKNLVTSGSYTLANARCSFVNPAFFWVEGLDASAFSGADSGSHVYKILVYDSAGKVAQGYPGAVGAGETLGDELVTDGDMSNPASWNVNGGCSIAGGVAAFSGLAAGSFYQDFTGKLATGSLARVVYIITNRTAGSFKLDGNVFGGVGTFRTTNNTFTEYNVATNTTNNLVFYGTTTFDGDVDDVSVKKYTDCAATGFHIISTQGGSTQNWTSVEAGFNYNDVSGYTYKIFRVR